jgi:hypothetical protein
MRRHVGPSSVWTAKYVLVVFIASGISTICWFGRATLVNVQRERERARRS